MFRQLVLLSLFVSSACSSAPPAKENSKDSARKTTEKPSKKKTAATKPAAGNGSSDSSKAKETGKEGSAKNETAATATSTPGEKSATPSGGMQCKSFFYAYDAKTKAHPDKSIPAVDLREATKVGSDSIKIVPITEKELVKKDREDQLFKALEGVFPELINAGDKGGFAKGTVRISSEFAIDYFMKTQSQQASKASPTDAEDDEDEEEAKPVASGTKSIEGWFALMRTSEKNKTVLSVGKSNKTITVTPANSFAEISVLLPNIDRFNLLVQGKADMTKSDLLNAEITCKF